MPHDVVSVLCWKCVMCDAQILVPLAGETDTGYRGTKDDQLPPDAKNYTIFDHPFTQNILDLNNGCHVVLLCQVLMPLRRG